MPFHSKNFDVEAGWRGVLIHGQYTRALGYVDDDTLTDARERTEATHHEARHRFVFTLGQVYVKSTFDLVDVHGPLHHPLAVIGQRRILG